MANSSSAQFSVNLLCSSSTIKDISWYSELCFTYLCCYMFSKLASSCCKCDWTWAYDINSSPPSACVRASVNHVSIGSDNGVSPIQCQAIIQTNAGLLSIRPLRTNFSEILIKIQNASFKKMHLKMSSAKMAAILYRGRWVKSLSAKLCLQRHGHGAIIDMTSLHWLGKLITNTDFSVRNKTNLKYCLVW